jgi:hypothetical protein
MSQSLLNTVAIAVFLMTFSALLSPLLPISPFFTAAITLGVLGLVTVDQWNWNGTGTKLVTSLFASKEERDRILHHEAGHFLAAYYLGIPVTGYSLTAWESFRQQTRGLGGIQFDTSVLSDPDRVPQQIPLLIERYATVWMAGIAAEQVIYGQADGGNDDRAQLRSLLQATGLSELAQTQKERWATLQAKNLISSHQEIYQSLVQAMAERRSVKDCYHLLQNDSLDSDS